MSRGIVAAIAVFVVVGLSLVPLLRSGEPHDSSHTPRIAADLADPVARGAYLARAANCRGCHTERGGADYAGGRGIPTPFGTFHAPNITPDDATGIGRWDADDFWRALHEGRGDDGEPLYPVFPYTHYTKLSRTDTDALFAFLRSLPAVHRENREHDLRFPYDQRWMLSGWRALFFTPGVYAAEPTRDDVWNRGAYLVQGLGHCGACHEARNALGAIRSRDNPAGGLVLDWYAPSLDVADEAGVAHWSREDIVALLRDGQANGASTLGPMADVVHDSLQHLAAADLEAMAAYLQALTPRSVTRSASRYADTALTASRERGAGLYREHCADCHGENGEGRAPVAPALVGNRAVTMDPPVNPIRVVLYGGFAPGTAAYPMPFGMPPFNTTLDDQQIADILNWLRRDSDAPPVLAYEIQRQRSGPLW